MFINYFVYRNIGWISMFVPWISIDKMHFYRHKNTVSPHYYREWSKQPFTSTEWGKWIWTETPGASDVPRCTFRPQDVLISIWFLLIMALLIFYRHVDTGFASVTSSWYIFYRHNKLHCLRNLQARPTQPTRREKIHWSRRYSIKSASGIFFEKKYQYM